MEFIVIVQKLQTELVIKTRHQKCTNFFFGIKTCIAKDRISYKHLTLESISPYEINFFPANRVKKNNSSVHTVLLTRSMAFNFAHFVDFKK